MRNQYISDYIHRVTGKRRTAKQVGSRLQQLRDTTEGKQCERCLSYFSYRSGSNTCAVIVLNSLTQHYNLGGKHISTPAYASSPDPSASDGSSSSESATSSNSSAYSQSHSTPLDTSVCRTFVCIELLPMDPTSTCSAYHEEQFFGSSSPAGGVFSSNGVTDIFRPSSHPRPICAIDPTITFVSRSVISAQSSCSVLLDGNTIHKEVTPLTLAGSCPDGYHDVDSPLLYGVKLVPSYWQLLCESPGKLLFRGQDKISTHIIHRSHALYHRSTRCALC
jgi:transcriptional enhancer factor